MELVSLFNPVLCFVTNRMPRGSCCIRFMNEDTDKNVDVDNVKPPPSFDPSICEEQKFQRCIFITCHFGTFHSLSLLNDIVLYIS